MTGSAKDKSHTPGDAVPGHGYLALLRAAERRAAGPRIGRNQRLAEESLRLGQDPYLAFPTEEISASDLQGAGRTPRLHSPVLGFFGPHGALPLNTTEEVGRWFGAGDAAFVSFTDILATRFIQLFFRAWSDAHAISQFDRPDDDRFQGYVAAIAGVATPAFRDRDGLPDTVRLGLVSLFGGRVRSPVRLQQMLALHLGVRVSVEEHVPGWLEFEDEDQNRLGQQGRLGRDFYLGARLRSVNETIRIHLRARDLAQYRLFLPGGAGWARLSEVVFWYLGKSLDVVVALSLPASQIPETRLGAEGQLGWMAALVADGGGRAAPDTMIEAAHYHLDINATTAAVTGAGAAL